MRRSILLLLAAATLLPGCKPAAMEPRQITPDELVCADPKAVPRVTFRFAEPAPVPEEPSPPGADRLRGLRGEAYFVRWRGQVSGRTITDVRSVHEAADGSPGVAIRFDKAGALQLKEMTRADVGVGKQLALVVDGVVISAPVINMPIEGGSLVVNGGFTEDESEAIAARIKGAARGCVLPPAPPA